MQYIIYISTRLTPSVSIMSVANRHRSQSPHLDEKLTSESIFLPPSYLLKKIKKKKRIFLALLVEEFYNSFMHSFNSSRAFAKSLSFCTWTLFPGGCKSAHWQCRVNIHSVKSYYCMRRAQYNIGALSGDDGLLFVSCIRMKNIK